MKKGLLKVLSATIIFMVIFTVAFPTINYAYSNINDIEEYTTNENVENEKTSLHFEYAYVIINNNRKNPEQKGGEFLCGLSFSVWFAPWPPMSRGLFSRNIC